VRRSRDESADSTLAAHRAAAERALAKAQQRQERLVRRYSTAEDDSFPWELVQREIKQAEAEKRQLQTVIEDLDARLALQQAAVDRLEALSAYCARVAARLANFEFEEKRLALEALSIRVVGNGHDWSLGGEVPTEGGEGVVSRSC